MSPLLMPPRGGSSSFANQPVGWTHTMNLDFSQTAPTTSADQSIVGATGWNAIGMGAQWAKISDPTEPQSPPGVWRANWAPGAYGGGVVGAGSGHGIGNIYTGALAGQTHVYLSLRVYFEFPDASYWHPISNKFVNLTCVDGASQIAQILMQLRESATLWRHAEELATAGDIFVDGNPDQAGEDHIAGVVANPAVPIGQWTEIEVIVDLSAKLFKIWQDGVLTTNATPNFSSVLLSEVGIYAFRGGGGETLDADLYYRYGHFRLAW